MDGCRIVGHCRLIALLAALFVAGCADAPREKPADVFTHRGALVMQSAADPESKLAVARMLCGKRGLGEETRGFARCVMKLHGRDRALSRARAAIGRTPAAPRAELCMAPGEFTLTRCYEI